MSFKSSWHIAINMKPYLSLSGNIVNDFLKHQEKWAKNMKFMIWARAWHWKMKNVLKSNEGNAFPWYIYYHNNSLRSLFSSWMSTLNFQDGNRRSSSVTLQLCSKVSAYKFLAQTTMIYHIREQKYEDQFATSNCNIFKARRRGVFEKRNATHIYWHNF